MTRSDENRRQEDSGAGARPPSGHDGPSIFHYQLKEKIGEGSFGTVWRAERDGMFVALKELNKSLDSKETQDELKSLEALKKLHHKSLLHTENSWTEAGRLYIEMELADGGSLKDRLKAYKAMGKVGIPEDELLKFFTETAQAIDYLHRQTPVMLHRDIKPGNILLVKGCAKIADFGLLRQVTGDKSATRTQGGTLLYLAPESIANDLASVHTDLWSFAVTYVELRQGALPFTGKAIGKIYDKIRWEPPELSDIFHPEEKKVILKALDKEPKSRHTSCYDFVFQLNRVVPWSPAQKVPVLDLPADPAESAPTPMTPPVNPAGMTAKNKPGATNPNIDLPPQLGTGTPTPSTEPRMDATEKIIRSPNPTQTLHKPDDQTRSTMPAHAPVEAPKPAVVSDPRPQMKAPAPRRRSRAPVLAAIFLATIAAAISAALWLLASFGEEEKVQAQINQRKANVDDLKKALAMIDASPRLLFFSSKSLREEVKRKWKEKITEKSASASDTNSRRDLLNALKDYLEQYADDSDLAGQRQDVLKAQGLAIKSEVESLLDGGRIEEAYRTVENNLEPLAGDMDKALRESIQEKKKVQRTLAAAGERLTEKDYEGCEKALEGTETIFRNDKDLLRKQELRSKSVAGKTKRDHSDAERITELAKLAKDNDLVALQKKLSDLFVFRKDYPKNDWSPSDVMLKKLYDPNQYAREELNKGWLALEEDMLEGWRKNLKDFRSQLMNLKKAPGFDPGDYLNETLLLESLVVAQQAPKDEWADACKGLLDQVPLFGKSTRLAPKLWKGLARLETEKGYFAFDQVADLESAYARLPLVAQTPIRNANSELLAHFLERTIKDQNYLWYPTKDQRDKCLDWITHVEAPTSDRLKAFKVECLIESGMEVNQSDGADFPLKKTDWYGGYVQALVEQKTALGMKGPEAARQYAAAARTLLMVLKDVPPLAPMRNSKALELLRGAVNISRGDKWLKPAATDAIPWFDAMLKLRQTPAEIDVLIDLAFAAVAAGDAETLKQVDERLDKSKYSAAEMQKGHLGLAKAYFEKGKSTASVVSHFESALALSKSGSPKLPKEMVNDLVDFARQLNRTADMSLKDRMWDDARQDSAHCEQLLKAWWNAGLGDDLEQAADLFANAVSTRANATAYEKGKTEDSKLDYSYRVYRDVTKKESVTGVFLFPVITLKLRVANTREQLDETIAEGEPAIKAAEKFAATRDGQKAWWDKKICLAFVALGQARELWIDKAIDAKVIDLGQAAGKDEFRTRTLSACANYQAASALKQYPELWFPHYLAGNAYADCVNVRFYKEDADIARAEFTKAQELLSKTPDGQLNQRERDKLKRIGERLEVLKQKTGEN